MSKRSVIFEGENKVFYASDIPGTLILHYKDDLFSLEGPPNVYGKAVLYNRISTLVMEKLARIGIATHFVESLNMREQRVLALDMLPLRVTLRNIAAGHLSQRLSLKEGRILPRPIVEFYIHNSHELVTSEHIHILGIATTHEVKDMIVTSLRVNDFMCGLFSGIDFTLVDISLRFGRYINPTTNQLELILGDDIGPDCYRLWDTHTWGNIAPNAITPQRLYQHDYQEVARRLGIVPAKTLKATGSSPRITPFPHKQPVKEDIKL